ncbi:MAG: NAD-dependent epimerase/dehydratase family protein [Pseudomonadota bacterium]
MTNQKTYKTILITGGAGFVGSNLAVAFKKKYPESIVIALDNLKRRGSEMNVYRLQQSEIEFLHGDIRNVEDLKFTFPVDLLIECSAEPSVLAGYEAGITYQINTNLVGTIHCLELAQRDNSDVIFLSTSRVYPYDALNSIEVVEDHTRFIWKNDPMNKILGWSVNGIDTNFSLNGPKSIYGATKLCSELLIQEYIAMNKIRAVINRCGVITGPWQFGKIDQGVFSLWMLSHYFKKNLSYIGFGGTGKQVRDLLHIDDLFELLCVQLENMSLANGKIYNVGGGVKSNLSLCETTRLCENITGNKIKISADPVNRSGDVKIYISDNNTAIQDFSWYPKITAEKTLSDIFNWIKTNENDMARLFN